MINKITLCKTKNIIYRQSSPIMRYQKKNPFLFNIFIVHGFNACPLFTLELHFESMFKIDPVTCGDQEYDTK